VDAPGPVHAGIDGEAVDLSPPLVFEVVPGALRVRIPAGQSGSRLRR
jgi:diacylglycerol kinase family enzyme